MPALVQPKNSLKESLCKPEMLISRHLFHMEVHKILKLNQDVVRRHMMGKVLPVMSPNVLSAGKEITQRARGSETCCQLALFNEQNNILSYLHLFTEVIRKIIFKQQTRLCLSSSLDPLSLGKLWMHWRDRSDEGSPFIFLTQCIYTILYVCNIYIYTISYIWCLTV